MRNYFLGEMNCFSIINVFNLWVFYLALIFIFKINNYEKKMDYFAIPGNDSYVLELQSCRRT